MNRRKSFFTFLSLAAAVFLFGPASTSAQTFSGQATAVRTSVRVGGLPALVTTVNDTGPLPAGGGSINTASAAATVPGVVTIGASTVRTSGGVAPSTPTTSNSFASVGSVSTTGFNNNLLVTAGLITSTTQCSCSNGTATCTGNFSIANNQITIGGTTFTVDATANQVFTATVGNTSVRVVVNEQIVTEGGLTVNGLHITYTQTVGGVVTTTDIIVASSHSDITCAGTLVDRFSGRAIGVDLRQTTDVLIPTKTSLIVSDTGPLPSSGGNISVSTASASALPLLSTGVVTSNTSGGVIIDRPAPLPDGTADTSQSDSTVNNLAVNLPGNIRITATVVQSNTQCTCSETNVATCTGDSVITNLLVEDTSVLGLPVTLFASANVDAAPNTVLNLGIVGLTIILNEQISGPGNITVNALHVMFDPLLSGLATTDLIVASSHSDILCATLSPTAADASVSGQVVDYYGRGISGARVTITNGSTGEATSVLTSTFGYYKISDLESANFYFMNARHKRYQFPSVELTLNDDVTGLDFRALAPVPTVKAAPVNVTTVQTAPVKTTVVRSPFRVKSSILDQ
ncbi:MAG: carboxypeptidase-like regulatory domain-containing protein [Pyrinomonadaceae bacterium]